MAEVKAQEKVDLWGTPFAEDPPKDSAPVVLLKEQAEVLSERTRGRVNGHILKAFDNGSVWASLYARVPYLLDYTHKLLTVAHSVDSNPVSPSPLLVYKTFGNTLEEELAGMDQFRSWLETALSSDEAHAVINNLLSYGPEPEVS